MKKILFLHDPLSSVPASLLSALVNLALTDHSYIKVLLTTMELSEKTEQVDRRRL